MKEATPFVILRRSRRIPGSNGKSPRFFAALRMTLFLFLLAMIVVFPAIAAETAYSSVLDDLPLMQGMTELPDFSTVLDNPSGRIIEFSAETKETPAAVRNFYQQTLPSLGWRQTQPAKFIRDKEALKIDFAKNNGETIVHFALTPASGGK